MLDTAAIAKVCHEANRAYCAAIGDHSQLPWEDAPEWQRESFIRGVAFHLANPHASASASHDAWWADKRKDGWVHGPVKDPVRKEHPCCVSFEELWPEQQRKDVLFKQIVHACTASTGPLKPLSPPVLHVMQFFKFSHLPPHLQAVSQPFAELAVQIGQASSNQETTVALRKLLESKDAAVRAVLIAPAP